MSYVPSTGGGGLLPPNIQAGQAYTYGAADANKLTIFTSSGLVRATIPDNATVPIAIGGSLATSVPSANTQAVLVPGAGVTLDGAGFVARFPAEGLKLVKTAADAWTVLGAAGSPYAYFEGGLTGASVIVASAERLNFSTGLMAANAASNLTGVRAGSTGVSDCATYGYVAGGLTGAAVVATANRITYATGVTAASTTATLSSARWLSASLSDGLTYGYVLGGSTSGSTVTVVVTADRLTFATGVMAASATSNMSSARVGPSSLSDGLTYGYITGGTPVTSDRLTFSTSVTAAHGDSDYPVSTNYAAALSDSSLYGYYLGGETGAKVATAYRLTFSTGVLAAHAPADLSTARTLATGASDGSRWGYVCGGDTGATVAITDRLTFATGVTAAFASSNLTIARSGMAGMSECSV